MSYFNQLLWILITLTASGCTLANDTNTKTQEDFDQEAVFENQHSEGEACEDTTTLRFAGDCYPKNTEVASIHLGEVQIQRIVNGAPIEVHPYYQGYVVSWHVGFSPEVSLLNTSIELEIQDPNIDAWHTILPNLTVWERDPDAESSPGQHTPGQHTPGRLTLEQLLNTGVHYRARSGNDVRRSGPSNQFLLGSGLFDTRELSAAQPDEHADPDADGNPVHFIAQDTSGAEQGTAHAATLRITLYAP